MNSFDGVSYALHTNDYGDTFSVDFRKSEDMDDFEVYSVRLGVNDVNEYNMRPTDAARDIATPQGIHLDSTREDLEAA